MKRILAISLAGAMVLYMPTPSFAHNDDACPDGRAIHPHDGNGDQFCRPISDASDEYEIVLIGAGVVLLVLLILPSIDPTAALFPWEIEPETEPHPLIPEVSFGFGDPEAPHPTIGFKWDF